MASRFRIGDLTLDTGRRQVLRDSQPIALGPLTYRLLLTLVEAAPNVVSHDGLAQAIWDGRAVSPETISQRVKLLRDALGDDPGSPRYVEGVRGQGYRLLPRVEAATDELPGRDRARWITPISVAGALVAAAAIALWIVAASPGTTRGGNLTVAPQSASIAVLPFTDLSAAHDQQYLADGIAEEILNLLSKATTLRVIARTSSFSFRDERSSDVTSIARALHVTHVLEGSVRKAGERIRVTVRLVDASDGGRLWSESYDRPVGDMLALQTDVARSVAAELKANLQDVARTGASPVSSEGYELYLQGQQKMRQWSYAEAASYFERAIALDSGFIPAYYGLGTAYVMQIVDVQVPVAANRDKLREVLTRGLRLAPDDAGLLALSAQLARYDGEMRLAEEKFAAALRRDPSNGVVRILYSMFKLDQGDPEEALRVMRRSLELDPFNPITYVLVWASHLDLWHEQEAQAAAAGYVEHSAAVDPTGHVMLGMTKLLLAGDVAGTISAIEQGHARIEPRYAGTPVWLPLFYYVVGDLQAGDAMMERARRTPWNGWWISHAEVYRMLAHGDVDQARRQALEVLTAQQVWGGGDTDMFILRLALDGLIATGEARRAVDLIERLAPEYARYRARKSIEPRDFSPAPIALKSAYSSYPALYFPDYIRALRAAGDDAGASRMLDHLDAVLALRRERGLFIQERHAAEAAALRGRMDTALDALEKSERDRTIYHWWQLELLHNEIFAGLRTHPRFVALIERVQRDLRRQREQLRTAQ